MPTPFMHLQMAERLLAHADLDGRVREQLCANLPAFYLGNIAPDFQAICDVSRRATHFYASPPEAGDYGAFARLLDAHPQLAAVGELSPAQAVFWAGYGAHLLYDMVWDQTLLTPYFRRATWGEDKVRYLAHNTLLTYMDTAALGDLPPQMGVTLQAAQAALLPIPFDPAHVLVQWQAMLVEQLLPGATARTVEIYAQRMRISPAEFAALLADEAWIAAHVFDHIPLAQVLLTVEAAVAQSIPLITEYLRVGA